ncbi:putative LysR-family transcriptional regulator [Pseudonocardia sp. Ae168_Ps1]|uniref:LysR family transcriptional regulator n=1 Tax=unclassified Pseudonocardia TaxID=2619320 RepID=UPI00094A9B5E|nr:MULTISPECIES: LysR family transcriptional regulator [unclassified Pseudonocardia]OLL72186.1 Chromosome initiation inhibitor [Pseudonocardia sp. Ae150A_Ps1]OLL78154.1 putative LysR-family transcriptional regulator [Pseudonocardia sp. Ae168_Ps1]OLL87723.1 Chromosome initiation inhibitor [Pseudonocardia sp. Ae263_Ps1]OLL92250.1 Chromosome initiation inhibitor [Pseudonocardia sp. Ae356_Ps1]
MELRHLRYLVTVVDEGTVTAAAERLHVAQPGVSAQLRQLERELGETLLERGPRAVVPTEAGRAVLPHARAALAAVEGARDAVAALRGLVQGRVAVGMASSLPDTVLADPVGDFAAEHPGVEVTLREGTTDELVTDLRAGRVDLAVLGFPTAPPDGLDGRVLVESELVAAVAADDAVAGDAVLPLAELVRRPLICLPRGHGLRTALDGALAAHGLTARVTFESGAMNLLLRLAARGAGTAVVPAPALRAAAVQVLERPPAALALEPEVRTRLHLVWRSGGPGGPAARALLDRLLG